MNPFEPSKNNRGRYKCPYCSHPTYKTKVGATNHIRKEHTPEAEKIALRIENVRLKDVINRKEQIIESLKIPPKRKTEYYTEAEYYYCMNEMKVSVGRMPKGVLRENVTCGDCGAKSIRPIINIQHATFKA